MSTTASTIVVRCVGRLRVLLRVEKGEMDSDLHLSEVIYAHIYKYIYIYIYYVYIYTHIYIYDYLCIYQCLRDREAVDAGVGNSCSGRLRYPKACHPLTSGLT